MPAPLLSLRGLRLGFGNTPLFDDADLIIAEGDRLCLVGRNGSGKSTLLRIAAGMIEPDKGERVLRQGATLRYLPQEPDLSGYASTGDYVRAGLMPGDDQRRAEILMEALAVVPEADPATLSGGETRRAALARMLAPEPDILLLDEPTNHLDLPAIEWLETELGRMKSALVLISHDRRFLANLTSRTLWLDRGKSRMLEAGFGAFEAWRDEQLEQEEVARHKLDRRIAAELDWVRYGVTARRKRNMGRMRALQALRQERRDQRRPQAGVQLNATDAGPAPKLVIDAEGINKSYGPRTILKDVHIRVRRGDRIGIIGANGAGKTTLLNILTGQTPPDSGKVVLGPNIEMVTLEQDRSSLDPNRSVKDTLTGGHGDQVEVAGGLRHVASYMKDFLFQPEQAGTPVGVLSGGERARLMLARALARPSNLLVLDEPTNDLDLETLDLLQEMLGDYGGTVLLVSHDRDFLDRVATGVVAHEGDGRWQFYPGGYSDMLAQRRAALPAKAAVTKIKDQPLETAKLEAQREARKRRLSFKEKHALETLPAEMERLRAEMAAAQKRLADPALFTRDPKAFAAASAALAEGEAKLAEAEDEWLRLEMLREEIEAGG